MTDIITFSFDASDDDTGTRIDKWLAISADDAGLSRSRIKTLITEGHLTCNGRTLYDSSATVKPGARYELVVPEVIDATLLPENIPIDILFEDHDIIVLNKVAGMVVHPAPGALSGTLVNALLAHCKGSLTGIGGVARPGIVHRLDKDTSGVMVSAKTDRAHIRLTEMFAAHDLERRYRTLVWGMPAERAGLVDQPLGRHRTDRKRQAVISSGRKAVTHYRTLSDLPPFGCLIECQLETGRTHQIRVHMAHLGNGVMGDPLYGKPLKSSQMPDKISREALSVIRAFPRQALHAASLGFEHPVSGEPLFFETDLPQDMQALHAHILNAIAQRAKI